MSESLSEKEAKVLKDMGKWGKNIRTFLLLLAILFITLKLTGVIAWSWFAVLLPIFPVVLATAVQLWVMFIVARM